jgi:hypothetical protein
VFDGILLDASECSTRLSMMSMMHGRLRGRGTRGRVGPVLNHELVHIWCPTKRRRLARRDVVCMAAAALGSGLGELEPLVLGLVVLEIRFHSLDHVVALGHVSAK